MNAPSLSPTFPTPEEAATHARDGWRLGWFVCAQHDDGRWSAFPTGYVTREGATEAGRAAMQITRDPSRVAVVGPEDRRLRVPVPHNLRRRAKGATP